MPQQLLEVRRYYNSGATLPYAFRRQQLLAFKDALLKYEEKIYDALFQDLGKSREEAYGTEVGLVLAEINYTLKHLRKWMLPKPVSTDVVNFPSKSKIYHDALGVVLIIAPFNYPLQLIFKPLVGAIAGGNCAVVKPSELTPATAMLMEEIIRETFSPSYIHIVTGDGAVVIPELMNAFRFDHIFYTGSTTVGKVIYQQAAKDLIPVTLELGGKSPCVIEADANLKVAARRVVIGKFTNTGQTCIAPDYLLVHEEVKEKFLSLLKETIIDFYSAEPMQNKEYGRIINAKHFDRLVSYMADGTIVHGGNHDRKLLYIAPTIIDGVATSHRIMKEEIFGPLLPVLTYRSTNDAMQIIQSNPDPLSFYLFTEDKLKEEQWISQLSFGNGCVNNTIWHFTNPHLPFGGTRFSGIGVYHGRFSFELFTRPKSVMKTPTWPDPRIKYPPLKGKLGFLKTFIR